MPKRLIEGENIWTSEKLQQVPEELRPEYMWVLPLAEANGCCEFSPAIIWKECYALLRPGWTPKRVEELFDALEAAKVVFRFKARYDQTQKERTWCYFVGMEKRLPRPSERSKYKVHRSIVPTKELAEFLGESIEIVAQLYRGVVATGSLLSVGVGAGEDVGVGIGSGSGSGSSSDADADAASLPSPTATETETETGSYTNQFQLNNSNSLTAANTGMDENIPADAGEFAKRFDEMLKMNPNTKPESIPKNQLSYFSMDFTELLSLYSREQVWDITRYSQSASKAKYYVRTMLLVRNADDLLSEIAKLKEKKVWYIVANQWNHVPVKPDEIQLEFLDEYKEIITTSFDLEGDDEELDCL
jgi:hypothetical protein